MLKKDNKNNARAVFAGLIGFSNVLISIYFIPIIIFMTFLNFLYLEPLYVCSFFVGVVLFVFGYFLQLILLFLKPNKTRFVFSIVSYVSIFLLISLMISLYNIGDPSENLLSVVQIFYDVSDISSLSFYIIHLVMFLNLVFAIIYAHLKVEMIEKEVIEKMSYSRAARIISVFSLIFGILLFFFHVAFFFILGFRSINEIWDKIFNFFRCKSKLIYVFVPLFYSVVSLFSTAFLIASNFTNSKKIKIISIVIKSIFVLLSAGLLIFALIPGIPFLFSKSPKDLIVQKIIVALFVVFSLITIVIITFDICLSIKHKKKPVVQN